MKNLKIPVIDSEGKVSGEEKFGIPASMATISHGLMAQAVRVFLSNQRKAKAKTKTRAEVEGSKSKIWRQKGTGRARHGDRQAPIFVGGGVAHGPRGIQNYQQKLNKKMSKKAIISALLNKLSEKRLFLIKEMKFGKTKEAYLYLKKVRENLKVKGEVCFLTGKKDQVKRYLRNLDQVQLINAGSLNPYYILKNDFVFLSPEGWREVEDYFNLEQKDVNRA